MKRAMFGIFLSLISINCFANATYAQDALKAMYAKGKLPKTGQAVTSEETVMDFNECRDKGNETYMAVADHFPAKIVVDSGVLYILKIWQSDALVIVNCSRTDGKRSVSRAAYQ